jgi:alpha-L-fucosidase
MDTTERTELMDNLEQAEMAEFFKFIPDSDLYRHEEFERNSHPDAQWFPGSGLGLFIHWGLSSVSGEYDLSWGMIKRPPKYGETKKKYCGLPAVTRHVPPAVYWQNAEKFDAANFDPDKWLSAAAKASFKYAILTTKHHDGFALWPSKHGDFNTKKHLGGRDLVKEYVEACRRHNLKVGLYFSPPDWYQSRDYMNYSCDPDHPCLDVNWEPITDHDYTPPEQGNPIHSRFGPPEFRKQIREYNRLLLEELLTNYGRIDLLWFDGPGGDCITVERMRELQPQILINHRGRRYGDFNSSAENAFPDSQYQGGWWDYCNELSDGGWGYMNHEIYKPTAWFLAELGKTRSWGGNFVVNVGPDCHGELPEPYYKRMAEIAAWMTVNSEAVFEVESAALWPDKSNVPVTRRSNCLYLHIHWLVGTPAELTDLDEPKSVRLEGVPIPYQYQNRTLTVAIPHERSSTLSKIVKVQL